MAASQRTQKETRSCGSAGTPSLHSGSTCASKALIAPAGMKLVHVANEVSLLLALELVVLPWVEPVPVVVADPAERSAPATPHLSSASYTTFAFSCSAGIEGENLECTAYRAV